MPSASVLSDKYNTNSVDIYITVDAETVDAETVDAETAIGRDCDMQIL